MPEHLHRIPQQNGERPLPSASHSRLKTGTVFAFPTAAVPNFSDALEKKSLRVVVAAAAGCWVGFLMREC